jgi:hydroxymethylpyrimidine/phosphomethylpyrimidine kinase
MRAQAVRLVEQGARAVLIKGGHGEGAESVDVLEAPGSFTGLATERIATRNTRGSPAARAPGLLHLAPPDSKHARKRPAVDGQVLSGDEARLCRAQERASGAEPFEIAQALGWN